MSHCFLFHGTPLPLPTITVGPPADLMLRIRDAFGITTFIETGTNTGRTTRWADRHFDSVYTIEASPEIYRNLEPLRAQCAHTSFLFGDSRQQLRDLVPRLSGSAVFWLDAHFSGGAQAGRNDECPLLEELRSVDASPHDHFLFIDDARFFTAPPPLPQQRQCWPELAQVIDALRETKRDQFIVIIADVLIAVPRSAEPLVAAWCQEAATAGTNQVFNGTDGPWWRPRRIVRRLLHLARRV